MHDRLPDEMLLLMGDLATLAIGEALERTHSPLRRLAGMALSGRLSRQHLGSPDTVLKTWGTSDRVPHARGGLTRVQKTDLHPARPPQPGSPADFLQQIADTLPDSRRVFHMAGRDLGLRRIGVVRVEPHANLPKVPMTHVEEDRVRGRGFPVNSGHRDNLPAGVVVSSEQLSGRTAEWSFVTSSGSRVSAGQVTGSRIIMRSYFQGMPGSGPWYDLRNCNDEPRLSLITSYS